MRLNTLTLFILLLCLGKAYGQRQNVYFFKEHGKRVKTRDSADYIRIISAPDTGSKFYNVKEYYKNGALKLLGKSSKIEGLVLEGQCATYYPSGQKQSIVSYTFGIPDGDAWYFYPNGKLYTHKKFLLDKPAPNTFRSNGVLIIENSDSTGKALVVEGNGHYVGYKDMRAGLEPISNTDADDIITSDFNTIAEEGDVKDRLKEGKWTSTVGSDKNIYTLTELYEDGKFISGESKDGKGETIRYTIKMREPSYPGGPNAFNMFLGRTVRYPQEARVGNIQGKVYISFIIEADGSVTEAKVERSPDPSLGRAALAAVVQSPPWQPGIQNGRPVRVHYTVPVNFALAYSVR